MIREDSSTKLDLNKHRKKNHFITFPINFLEYSSDLHDFERNFLKNKNSELFFKRNIMD